MSQEQQILNFLAKGNRINPLLALRRFQCFRLGARIHTLKAMGHKIDGRMKKTKSGKHVKEYWLCK